MKKWITFFVLFVVVVVVAFGAYLFFNQAEFASARASKLFGTRCTVQKVSWSPKGFTFQNVMLQNPANCVIKTAFSVKTIQVRMDFSEQMAALFGYRPAVIEKIYIDKPLFSIEFTNPTGSESNWKTLLDNVVDNYTETDKTRQIHIKQLLFEHISLELKTNGRVRHPKDIKKIQMGQLAGSPPATIDKLLFGAPQMALVQIGEAINQPLFYQSIIDIQPPGLQHSLELIKRKAAAA